MQELLKSLVQGFFFLLVLAPTANIKNLQDAVRQGPEEQGLLQALPSEVQKEKK